MFEHRFEQAPGGGDLDPASAGGSRRTWRPGAGEVAVVELMRRYDEPVEVRCGLLAGTETTVPEQFLWRGRLWKVRSVLEHWVETGEWWRHAGVRAVLGSDEPAVASSPERPAQPRPLEDLLAERAVWRVEAGRGAAVRGTEDTGGVFDLALDVDGGRWLLVGCAD